MVEAPSGSPGGFNMQKELAALEEHMQSIAPTVGGGYSASSFLGSDEGFLKHFGFNNIALGRCTHRL